MPFRGLQAGVIAGALPQPIAATLVTTNNTATVIASVTLPRDSSMYIEVKLVGRRTDGANAGDLAAVTLTCAYKSIAGVLTQVGADTSTVVYASASINASAASSAASGAQLQIKIAGVAAATIDWQIAGFAYQSI